MDAWIQPCANSLIKFTIGRTADGTWQRIMGVPDCARSIAATTPPILRKLGLAADQWHTQATGIEQRYWRAVGAVDALIEKARDLGQCWLKGAGTACRQRRKQDA